VGIRQHINANPKLSIVVACGLIAIATLSIVPALLPKQQAQQYEMNGFYTVDDGRTFFKAPLANIPPFDHQGQQAVRAYVFKAGDSEFVGYMEQFTAEGKRKIEEFLAANPQVRATPGIYKTEVELYQTLVKRPGDAQWTPCSLERRVVEITTVKAPDGSPAKPVQP
jgi:hypothetical protein